MSIECLNLSITKRRGMRLFEKRPKRTQNGFDYCNFRQWEARFAWFSANGGENRADP